VGSRLIRTPNEAGQLDRQVVAGGQRIAGFHIQLEEGTPVRSRRRCLEVCSSDVIQVKRSHQALECVGIGEAADSSLEIRDRAYADARAVGKRILSQPGDQPEASQQLGYACSWRS